jgi:predicted aconitase
LNPNILARCFNQLFAQLAHKNIDDFQLRLVHPTVQVIDKFLLTYTCMNVCAVCLQSYREAYMTLREKLEKAEREILEQHNKKKGAA